MSVDRKIVLRVDLRISQSAPQSGKNTVVVLLALAAAIFENAL